MPVTVKEIREYSRTLRKVFNIFEYSTKARQHRLTTINDVIAKLLYKLPRMVCDTHQASGLQIKTRTVVMNIERKLEAYGLVRGVDGASGRGWGGLERSSLRPLDKSEESGRKARKRARIEAFQESRKIAGNKVVEDWMDVVEEGDVEKQGELRRSKRIVESNLKVIEEDEIVIGDACENGSDDGERDYIPLCDMGDDTLNRWVDEEPVDEDMDESVEDDDDHLLAVKEKEEVEDDRIVFMDANMERSDEDDNEYIPPVNSSKAAKDNRTEIVDLTMDTDQSENDHCRITLVLNRTKTPEQNRTEYEVAVAAQNTIHEYDHEYRLAIDRKKRVEESWIELGMVLKDELLWCNPRDYFDEDLLP